MDNEQIVKLATARAQLEEAKSERDALMLQVTESQEYKRQIEIITQAQAAIADATREIQAAALDEYAATGSKKPHPAIGIRVNTQLVYDADQALTWSRSNLLAAVTLDRRMFEAHAKAVAKTQPIEFVQIVNVPSITVASDLSEYLPDPIEQAEAEVYEAGIAEWVKWQEAQNANTEP